MPALEHLENRILPAPIYVDAGVVTGLNGLIHAISQANSDYASTQTSDTIILNADNQSSSVYSFTAANNSTNGNNVLPVVTAKGLLVQGGNSTLNAGGNGRLFDVSSGASVTLEQMTLTGGKASGATAEGGAVFNSGQLTMKSVTIGGNSAAGGSGQNAAGGGIYSNGSSLTLVNDTIGLNAARHRNFVTHTTKTTRVGGSNKAIGGTGGSGQGGGVYAAGGTVSVSNCVIAGNLLSGSVNVQGGGLYASGVTQLNLSNDVIGMKFSSSVNAGTTTKATTVGNTNNASGGSNVQGGGLYISGGTVNVTKSNVSQNRAQAGNGAAGGGNGGNVQGGGIYALNTNLTLTGGSNINGNLIGAGQGGSGTRLHLAGGQGGNAQGGGVFASNSTLVINAGSTVFNDEANAGNGGKGGNALAVARTASANRPGETAGGQGGNGGLAQGGGLYAYQGTVTVAGTNTTSNNSSISSNGAVAGMGGVGGNGGAGVGAGVTGGVGGAGGAGGEADGGGVYINAAPFFANGGVTISNNVADAQKGGQGGRGGLGLTSGGNGGNGGNGGSGGNGGLSQGGGLFATGSGLAITLGDAHGGVVISGNNSGGGGLGLGAGGNGGPGAYVGTVSNGRYVDGLGGNGGNGNPGTGGGATILGDTLTVMNATIQSNSAGGGGGGGNSGHHESHFAFPGGGAGAAGGVGGAGQGGGLFVSGSRSVLILNSTLSANNAFQAFGGQGGNAGRALNGAHLPGGNGGNGSTQRGGGLYAASSIVTAINSTIADNIAYDAKGGLGGTGYTNALNGSASANGPSQGGGIFATGGSLSLVNDTIAWNFLRPTPTAVSSSDQGGGIFNDSSNTLTMQNTIVALDQIYYSANATSTSTDLTGAAATSSDHNFIGDGTGISSGLTNGSNGNQVGTDANQLNPQFAVAAAAGPGQGQLPGSYEGPTPTLPLNWTSAALRVGNPAAATAVANAEGVASSNATDQRGLPRLTQGAIDIGATETQMTLTDVPSSATVQANGTITYTLTVINNEATAANVTLTDVLDGNTTYQSSSGASWTITPPSSPNPGGNLTATTSLAANSSASLTITVAVSSSVASNTTIANNASLALTANTNFAAANSVTADTTISGGMASTTTTSTSAPNPSVFGQNVTFTATVHAGSGTPTGTVTFKDGSTILGAGALSGGVATFSTSALLLGSHSITADYSGDANDSSSTSTTFIQVVNQDSTTTNLSSSAGTAVFGQTVTFTATVTANSPGAGTPTGTVTFKDGSSVLGNGTLSGGVATFSTNNLSVASHNITAVYGGDGNDAGGTSTAVNQVVNQDQTTTSLVSSSNSTVYSQSVTFTATVRVNSPGAGTPAGTVTFYDGSNSLGTGTLSNGAATLTTSMLSAISHSITAVYGGDTNDAGSTSSAVTQTVNLASTATTLASSIGTSPFGQSVIFTATVSATSPATAAPTGSVDFVDTTTGNDLGTFVLSSSGTASVSVSNLEPGSHVIQAIYSGQSGAFLGSTSLTLTQSVTQSILVLDGSDASSLKLSGNAVIHVPGDVIVDSSSPQALTASGNAGITAAGIEVVGGVSISGTASLSPAPTTLNSPVPNPLASLTGPDPTGLTNYGAVSYSSGTHPLSAGIYTSIKASGNATLTLGPGIYLIEGGGVAVSGNASVSGTGVMIYNTSSNYPLNTGSYGGITLSGNGSFSLTAPTTGLYAGIVIFQPSANTRAISLSGNATDGLGGTIYAPAALLYESGNASVNGALVVNQLSLSGNAASTQTAAGSNADNAGSTAGELLEGDVSVYVNNVNGDLTADELARIQDAVNAVNGVTSPYGVSVAEVTDPTLANATLSMGTNSAAGNFSQGVLGCYSTTGQITLIQGWNWYAGADPTQIGANQYDFQTTVTHELGHALGLGESSVTTSAMYGTLTPATAIRTLTTADLCIPYAEAGADAQRAALPALPASTSAVAGNNAAVVQLPTTAIVPSGPVSAVDQVFANLAFLMSDMRNVYQSVLASFSAMWQQADALAMQRLDVLLSLEAGAMGMSKDTFLTALWFANRSGNNGA